MRTQNSSKAYIDTKSSGIHTNDENVQEWIIVKRLIYCQKMQVTNLGRRRTWVAEQ